MLVFDESISHESVPQSDYYGVQLFVWNFLLNEYKGDVDELMPCTGEWRILDVTV